MPHLRIQTTANLTENARMGEILERMVRAFSGFETIQSASVKGYHLLHETWCLGAGAKPGFVHCELAILSGRPVELRRKLADEMYSELKTCFAESLENGEANLTLEVREMDRDTYQK